MVDRKAAAEELLRRQKIRGSMVEFARACNYEPAPHHRHIISHLEKVASGELRRLLIAAPPGSAKSTYASVIFPAWYLSKHPDHQIICASHTVELAEKHARRARNLIMEHSTVLGVELADDSQSAGRWTLKSGGSVFAVGAGGAVVGQRADAIIIDDPLRGREEAHSESAREKLYEWYVSDALTRLRPGGRIVLISTRWHEDDLFGRLADSSRYKIVSLPAVAESDDDPLGRQPGEYLWDSDPEYPYGEFLRAQREVQLPSNWSALFQQRPAPEEGSVFKSAWLKKYHHAPARDTMRTYIAVDFATSEGKGDFTSIVAFGLDPQGDIFVLDVWRKQASPDVSVDALLDMTRDWKPLVIVTEAGGLKNAIGPFLRERMQERNVWSAIETVPARHAKEIRAQSIAGRAAVRGIYLPAQAPWLADFVSELLSFPAGKHDDMVDCCSLLGQLLDKLAPGSAAPKASEPPKILSTDPTTCTVTLTDLFEAEERRHRRRSSSGRIW